jgi:hypothetical protein
MDQKNPINAPFIHDSALMSASSLQPYLTLWHIKVLLKKLCFTLLEMVNNGTIYTSWSGLGFELFILKYAVQCWIGIWFGVLA